MDPINKIEDHLYLSGSIAAEDLSLLQKNEIRHILSVFEDELQKYESINYKLIKVFDYEYEDLMTYFPEINKFIGDAQAKGENVLIHCHAGYSRSPTFVLAFIMSKHNLSYESAYDRVKYFRQIGPNDGFKEQLRLYYEMGFTLNANNRLMRRHLMLTKFEVFEYILCEPKPIEIEKYFKGIELIEGMTQDLDLGDKYLCAKCGEHLFNELHTFKSGLTNKFKLKSNKCCKWTYIEPQIWMSETLKNSENKTETETETELMISCKCGEEVVHYKPEYKTYLCECPLHSKLDAKCLRFRIANKKYKIESKVYNNNCSLN